MKLNRIQIKIFEKLSREKGLETDAFVKQYSFEFIGIQRENLQELSEEEGDIWINRTYLLSLH